MIILLQWDTLNLDSRAVLEPDIDFQALTLIIGLIENPNAS